MHIHVNIPSTTVIIRISVMQNPIDKELYSYAWFNLYGDDLVI